MDTRAAATEQSADQRRHGRPAGIPRPA